MAQKKFSRSPQSSETKPNTKLVLVSREPLINKPNKTFMRLIHLITSTFLSRKKLLTYWFILGMRNISKHHFLKSDKLTHNLAFRWVCSSPFHGTAASKAQLTANCIAAKRYGAPFPPKFDSYCVDFVVKHSREVGSFSLLHSTGGFIATATVRRGVEITCAREAAENRQIGIPNSWYWMWKTKSTMYNREV